MKSLKRFEFANDLIVWPEQGPSVDDNWTGTVSILSDWFVSLFMPHVRSCWGDQTHYTEKTHFEEIKEKILNFRHLKKESLKTWHQDLRLTPLIILMKRATQSKTSKSVRQIIITLC